MSNKKTTHREREPHELDSRIEKLKSGRGIFNFEGKLITQIIGGWQFQNQNYSTPEEVLKAIKVSEGYLEGSITVSAGSGGNIAVNSPDAENNHDLCTDGTHVWER